MSLIKMAMGIAELAHLPAVYTMRAALSGKPINYFTRQGKSIATKRIQNFGLATLANAEAQLRKGRVADSTQIGAAFVDGKLFGNALGGAFQTVQASKKGPFSNIIQSKLKKYISNEGQYNIKAITNDLKKYNNVYQDVKKLSYSPLATRGAVYGTTVGAITSYDNDKGVKSVLPGAIKGGIIGSALGQGIKESAKKIKNMPMAKNIEIAHNQIIHKNNYWINRLNDANKLPYQKSGKALAHLLTDKAGKRFARIKRSEAFTDLWETNGNLLKKQNRTDLIKKVKNLGHWTNEATRPADFLNKKYMKQIKMADRRGDI